MATATTIQWETLEDLIEQLGGIPPHRIRMSPLPGLATEADLIAVMDRTDRLCELVDGVLVEKAVGYQESLLAGFLIAVLRAHVIPRNLGVVSGADGFLRLFPGLVRAPDVAFASWDRFPGRRLPPEAIPSLVPDLAIEVLSESNTRKEMRRKRGEYFSQGVSIIWEIDPRARMARVYKADGTVIELTESDRLDGGDVLPGFSLELSELFAELDRRG